MDVLSHVAKITTLSDAADVNNSGSIDVEDAVDILRHVAKIIDLANLSDG